MKTIKIIAVSLLLSVIYLGCGKEDPCANVKEVKANFRSDEKMFLHSFLYQYIIPYDYTLLMGSPAFAIDSSVEWDSLEWRIGGETIYNEPSFRRFSVPPGDLPVTLIVKKKPNTKCFPKDDGRDTITKVYKIASDFSRDNRLVGTYRVKFDNFPLIPDSFEFSIVNTQDYAYMDTFPLIQSIPNVRYPIRMLSNTLNEAMFWENYYGNTQTDSNNGFRYFYFRNTDNHSNKIELIINPHVKDNEVKIVSSGFKYRKHYLHGRRIK